MATDKETLKKKTIPLLRAVLTAKAKVGVPLHMLCREYEETCMESLKFREMGFGSLEQFLRDCSEVCYVERANEGYLVAKAIASKEDAHIFRLVSGQRKDKKKSKKVSLAVKRRGASTFTGGRKPNFFFSPKTSILGSFPTNRPFSAPYTNKYFKLKQTPTKSAMIVSNNVSNTNNSQKRNPYNTLTEVPPRFARQANNKAAFVSNVQKQVNLVVTHNNNNNNNNTNSNSNTTRKVLLPNENSSSVARSNLSKQELSTLENKLRKLLIPKTNGLWATRLRPEFKNMYKEQLPDDVRVIIQENFLHFIKIDSPMPNMEILYLKEEAKDVTPNGEQNLDVNENIKNLTNGVSSSLTTSMCNGTKAHEDAQPEVICLTPKADVPPINLHSKTTHHIEKNDSDSDYELMFVDYKSKLNIYCQQNKMLQIPIYDTIAGKNGRHYSTVIINDLLHQTLFKETSSSSHKLRKNAEQDVAKVALERLTGPLPPSSPRVPSPRVPSPRVPSSPRAPSRHVTSPHVPSSPASSPHTPNQSSGESIAIGKSSPTGADFKLAYLEIPSVGDEFKVFVCHVESLDRFFVQYADSAIQDLVDGMQLFYEDENSDSMDLGKPKLNEYCCARYSKDKLWFRSKILSVKEQKNILNESYRCRVIFVDYGNDEYVISSELKRLTNDFCKLPAQAVQCCLHKLLPMEGSSWNEKVVEHFRAVTDNVELTMTIKERNGPVLSIDLSDSDGKSVCGYLCSQKLGKQSDSISPQVETHSSPGSTSPRTPTPDRTSSDNESVSHPPPKQEILPQYVQIAAGVEYIDMSISHINSTNDLYIILIGPEHNVQLDRLEEKMSNFFDKNTDSAVPILNVGGYYAICYEEDWVRVQIIDIHGNDYELLLLDRGNKTIVAKEEIKDLPMQFLRLPFQAIPCSLYLVNESFDAEILQILTDALFRKTGLGSIMERPSESTEKMMVELYETSNEAGDININEIIKKKIESEKNLCPKLPEVGDGHCNAYIAYISPVGDVYLQILGPGTERLEILMSDMEGHFQVTRAYEIVQRPEIDQICCAKFIEDGLWYRAKITQVMQKERKVEVEFIDYGNREQIQMLFIRNPDAVNKKVVSLPAQAIKCHISGLPELTRDADSHKKIQDYSSTLDIVYVNVLDLQDDNTPVVKIFVQSEKGPVEFISSYEEQLAEEDARRSSESSCHGYMSTDSGVFNTTLDNASFEDISIAGEESFCKINPLRTNDSNTILSEYDVITDVPTVKEMGKPGGRERTRSESPACIFSASWGLPKMMLTEPFIEGSIQDCHDPYKFSFIPFTLWDDLERLHVKMMETYKQSPSEAMTLDVGDICAVFHHQHEIWYRAVIVAVIDDQVVVKYPDFSGTPEVESLKNIRTLLPQFKEMPFTAVRCKLSGIDPMDNEEWSQQSIQVFRELVLNETFQVEIITRDDNEDFSKPLEVVLHGCTADSAHYVINEKLVRMGVAQKKKPDENK